jgi:CelD/BcsL family acetyltransferase involved in cellulose biosynthesis
MNHVDRTGAAFSAATLAPGLNEGMADGEVDAFFEIACPPYDGVSVIMGEPSQLLKDELKDFAAKAIRTPFQADAWATAFRAADSSENRVPVTAIAHVDGRIAVVLPLFACKAPGLRYLTWQARTPSDYCAPLVAPDFLSGFETSDAAALMRAVAAHVGGIDLIYLPKMLEQLGSARNPLVTADSWSFYARAHAIRIEGGWDEFYAAIRSPRSRQTLKRKEKALRKMGEIGFVLTHEAEQVKRITDACLAMKTSQLEREGHANLFADKRMYEAMITAMRDACPKGAWAASFELDNKPLAAAFGLIEADEWLLYQFAMADGPESRHSPGVQLLVELLRSATESGAKMLDLALGDEAYKFDWCNVHRELKTTVLPLTAAGHVAARALRLREKVRVWLAKNPATLRLSKRIKPMLRRSGVSA